MITIKQLLHRYEITLASLNSAFIRLGIEPYPNSFNCYCVIKSSYVPLLDTYFNYHG